MKTRGKSLYNLTFGNEHSLELSLNRNVNQSMTCIRKKLRYKDQEQ